MTKKKLKYPDLGALDRILRSASQGIDEGRYLEPALVMFQSLEFVLRYYLVGLFRTNGVPEDRLEKIIIEEQRVSQLVKYLELMRPQDPIVPLLNRLNGERNQIVHRLLFHPDPDALSEDLRRFGVECRDIVNELTDRLSRAIAGDG